MTKMISRFILAFDKAFPWTKVLDLVFIALMSSGLAGNDAWMALLSDVYANGFDERFSVGVTMGIIIVSFWSVFCRVALFVWYLFVPSKEVN